MVGGWVGWRGGAARQDARSGEVVCILCRRDGWSDGCLYSRVHGVDEFSAMSEEQTDGHFFTTACILNTVQVWMAFAHSWTPIGSYSSTRTCHSFIPRQFAIPSATK